MEKKKERGMKGENGRVGKGKGKKRGGRRGGGGKGKG